MVVPVLSAHKAKKVTAMLGLQVGTPVSKLHPVVSAAKKHIPKAESTITSLAEKPKQFLNDAKALPSKLASQALSKVPGLDAVTGLVGSVSRLTMLSQLGDNTEAAVAAGSTDDMVAPIEQPLIPNVEESNESVPALSEETDPVEIEQLPPYDLIVGTNLSSSMICDAQWDLMEILNRWRFIESINITSGTSVGNLWIYEQKSLTPYIPSYILPLLSQFNYMQFALEFQFRLFSTEFDSGLLRVFYDDVGTVPDHSVYHPSGSDFSQGFYIPFGSNLERSVLVPYSGTTPDAVIHDPTGTNNNFDFAVSNYNNRLTLSLYTPCVAKTRCVVLIYSRFVSIVPKAPLCDEFVLTSLASEPQMTPSTTVDDVSLPTNDEVDFVSLLQYPKIKVYSFNDTTENIVLINPTHNDTTMDPPAPSQIMPLFCKFVSGGISFKCTLVAPNFRSCVVRVTYADGTTTMVARTNMGDTAVFDLSTENTFEFSVYPRTNQRKRMLDGDTSFGQVLISLEAPYADNSTNSASLIVESSPTSDTDYFHVGRYKNIYYANPTGSLIYVNFNYITDWAANYPPVPLDDFQQTAGHSELFSIGTAPSMTQTTNNSAPSDEVSVVAPVNPYSLMLTPYFLQQNSLTVTDNKINQGAHYELFFANPMNLFSLQDKKSSFARAQFVDSPIVRPSPVACFGHYFNRWNGDFVASCQVAGSTAATGTFALVFVPHSGVPTYKEFQSYPHALLDLSTERTVSLTCPYDCSTPFKIIPPTIGKQELVSSKFRISYWGSNYEIQDNQEFDLTCSGVLYLVALSDIYVPGDSQISVGLTVSLSKNFRMFGPRTPVSFFQTTSDPVIID